MHLSRWPLFRAHFLAAAAVALLCASCDDQNAAKPVARPKPAVTFKPQEMADALHAVIAADRETYSRHFAQYQQSREAAAAGGTSAAAMPPLPIPAHLLRQASEAVQQKGAEFHYVLRSLWPINPKNAPETPTEKAGLEFVAAHPGTNYYAEESLGGRLYFAAIYPDVASNTDCADCHNRHPDSPKRDFKTGDVMGGMVVRVPLEF